MILCKDCKTINIGKSIIKENECYWDLQGQVFICSNCLSENIIYLSDIKYKIRENVKITDEELKTILESRTAEKWDQEKLEQQHFRKYLKHVAYFFRNGVHTDYFPNIEI
jgi:hypothetical protein